MARPIGEALGFGMKINWLNCIQLATCLMCLYTRRNIYILSKKASLMCSTKRSLHLQCLYTKPLWCDHISAAALESPLRLHVQTPCYVKQGTITKL